MSDRVGASHHGSSGRLARSSVAAVRERLLPSVTAAAKLCRSAHSVALHRHRRRGDVCPQPVVMFSEDPRRRTRMKTAEAATAPRRRSSSTRSAYTQTGDTNGSHGSWSPTRTASNGAVRAGRPESSDGSHSERSPRRLDFPDRTAAEGSRSTRETRSRRGGRASAGDPPDARHAGAADASHPRAPLALRTGAAPDSGGPTGEHLHHSRRSLPSRARHVRPVIADTMNRVSTRSASSRRRQPYPVAQALGELRRCPLR